MENSLSTLLIVQSLFFILVLATPSTEAASMELSNMTELATNQTRVLKFQVAAALLSYDDSVAFCASLNARLCDSLDSVELGLLAVFLIAYYPTCVGTPIWALLRLGATIPTGSSCTVNIISAIISILGISPSTSLRACVCVSD